MVGLKKINIVLGIISAVVIFFFLLYGNYVIALISFVLCLIIFCLNSFSFFSSKNGNSTDKKNNETDNKIQEDLINGQDLDNNELALYKDVIEAFKLLSKCEKKWLITSSKRNEDIKSSEK